MLVPVTAIPGLPLSHAQRAVNRLFGVRLKSDVHERAADLRFHLPAGWKRRQRLSRIAERGILFIHIPKNGGTSVSRALYGISVGHATIRFYQSAARELAAKLPSFAILRDPEERFLSGYRHAVAGGAADSHINLAFRDRYRGFRSIDDALDHLEQASSPYAIDHIFRPQSWYLTGRDGSVAVDNLVMIEQLPRLGLHLPFVHGAIPHLNRSQPIASALTQVQRQRLRGLYADDLALIAAAHGGAGIRTSPPRGAPAFA